MTDSTLLPTPDPSPGGQLLIYHDGGLNLQVRLDGQTVWLTQAGMAELFQTTPQNITMHIAAIYEEAELPEEATCKEFLQVRTEGNRQVQRSLKHYSLDLIVAVGFRVRSHLGTRFRQWATAQIRELLTKGFVLDDERIKAGRTIGQDHFEELLARIRDIRASERLFYQKITDIFATSIDYDPKAEVARTFFATVQNKLHWAIHGRTAAEMVVERADSGKPNMGLTTWKNAPHGPVRKADVDVAKNYLKDSTRSTRGPPMMTLMQLIKLVLDDAYKGIHLADEAEKDKLIAEEIEGLAMEYASLANTKAKPIDYSDSLKRFAYIYKYTVAHADYIMQLINSCEEVLELFTRRNVEIACLGGGPGSDLLGVLKHMIQAKVQKTCLTCYIFDRERAWGDSWSDVARCLDAPFRVYPVFQQMDVTDSSTWASYGKFLRADLFTLSYFMSEVWKIKTQAEPFFNHCLARMKRGGLVLFIDNNSPVFYDWFDFLAQENKLEQITAGKRTLAFSNDEEKTDLGIYFKKFGWPKRKGDVAYRVMRKV